MGIVTVVLVAVIFTRPALMQPSTESRSERWTVALNRVSKSPVYLMAFSTDGKSVVVGHSGPGYQVLEVQSGSVRPISLGREKIGVGSIILSPDGGIFGITKRGRESQATLCEFATRNEFPSVKSADFSVRDVAFSRDGKFMAILGVRQFRNPWGTRVKVFDLPSRKELFEVGCDCSHSRLIAILPDNKTLVAPGPGQVLKYWDLKTGKEHGKSPKIDGYTLALALQGKAVVAGTNSTISLFDLETGKRKYIFDGTHPSRLPLVSADGNVLVSGLKSWDLTTGKELAPIDLDKAERDRFRCMAVSPDGYKLAIGTDISLSLWVREKAKQK